MKQILLFLALSIVLAGCRTTRKTSETQLVTSKTTEVIQQSDLKENTKVDNDKLIEETITTVTTEYYQPISGLVPERDAVESGAVKSITTTTTKKKEVDRGKTEVITTDQSGITTKTKDNSEVKTKVVEKAKKPIQWGWIFGILVILAVGILYMRKTPVFGLIKNIFQSIK